MAQSFWTAIFGSSTVAIVTVILTFLTKQKKSDSELVGLVYQLTPKEKQTGIVWYKRTITLAVIVLLMAAILSVIFW
jgi:SSS family solute:Na+ symporter